MFRLKLWPDVVFPGIRRRLHPSLSLFISPTSLSLSLFSTFVHGFVPRRSFIYFIFFSLFFFFLGGIFRRPINIEGDRCAVERVRQLPSKSRRRLFRSRLFSFLREIVAALSWPLLSDHVRLTSFRFHRRASLSWSSPTSTKEKWGNICGLDGSISSALACFSRSFLSYLFVFPPERF